MSLITILVLVLSFVLGMVYYLGNQIDIKKKSYQAKIISLSAGISITYLILELFPSFTVGAFAINQLLFLAVLFGFIIHHVIEKNIFRHHHMKQELIRLLTVEENMFSYAYHFLVGILLLFFMRLEVLQGILFFFPILSYTLVNAITMKPHDSKLESSLNASASFVGVIFGLIFFDFISLAVFYLLLGIVTGILLFSITRHQVPFGNKGQPEYFILGTICYGALIVGSWFL